MSGKQANERIDRRATSQTTTSRSYIGIVIIIAALIVCILVGIILYLLFGKESEPRNIVVTPENVEELISQLDKSEYTAPGSYEVTMNTKWEFANGKAASPNAYVENCIRNQNTVYFTIVLSSDTNHEIYHSPDLPIGSYIKNISLDEDLDAGVYDAILTYHLLGDKQQDLSEVSVRIQITVQK